MNIRIKAICRVQLTIVYSILRLTSVSNFAVMHILWLVGKRLSVICFFFFLIMFCSSLSSDEFESFVASSFRLYCDRLTSFLDLKRLPIAF
jgi:hypothetical protein